jgi:hypothetical protein
MAAGVGGVVQPNLGVDVGGLWGPLAKLKALAWALFFSKAPGQLTWLWRAGSSMVMARGGAYCLSSG